MPCGKKGWERMLRAQLTEEEKEHMLQQQRKEKTARRDRNRQLRNDDSSPKYIAECRERMLFWTQMLKDDIMEGRRDDLQVPQNARDPWYWSQAKKIFHERIGLGQQGSEGELAYRERRRQAEEEVGQNPELRRELRRERRKKSRRQRKIQGRQDIQRQRDEDNQKDTGDCIKTNPDESEDDDLDAPVRRTQQLWDRAQNARMPTNASNTSMPTQEEGSSVTRSSYEQARTDTTIPLVSQERRRVRSGYVRPQQTEEDKETRREYERKMKRAKRDRQKQTGQRREYQRKRRRAKRDREIQERNDDYAQYVAEGGELDEKQWVSEGMAFWIQILKEDIAAGRRNDMRVPLKPQDTWYWSQAKKIYRHNRSGFLIPIADRTLASCRPHPQAQANTPNEECLDTQPSSFADTQPSSVLETQPSFFLDTQPSSFADTQPSSFPATQSPSSVDTQSSYYPDTQSCFEDYPHPPKGGDRPGFSSAGSAFTVPPRPSQPANRQPSPEDYYPDTLPSNFENDSHRPQSDRPGFSSAGSAFTVPPCLSQGHTPYEEYPNTRPSDYPDTLPCFEDLYPDTLPSNFENRPDRPEEGDRPGFSSAGSAFTMPSRPSQAHTPYEYPDALPCFEDYYPDTLPSNFADRLYHPEEGDTQPCFEDYYPDTLPSNFEDDLHRPDERDQPSI